MKPSKITAFIDLMAIMAASALGLGSQGELYVTAGDLVNKAIAWSKECGGKTADEDCERNLYALRETAYKAAVFPMDIAIDDCTQDKNADGNNGWRAHWLMYAQLFRYHGDCFNRYDCKECTKEWAAFEKEKRRLEGLYGPEPRWQYFPEALKGRVFRPIPSDYTRVQ